MEYTKNLEGHKRDLKKYVGKEGVIAININRPYLTASLRVF